MTLTVLHGENDFEKRQALAGLVADVEPERYDGETLTLESLRELCIGQTLFASERTIIVYGLSDNGELWPQLPEVLHDVTSTIILVEGKLDKRTKAYKWLTKHATVEEFAPLSDRQRPVLIDWAVKRATHYGYALDAALAGELIDRLSVDQLRLDSVLEQLSFVENLTLEVLQTVVPLAKSESVFGLFEAALQGRVSDVKRIIAYLEHTEGDDGAYMTMGLLASQLVNLNALVLSGGDSAKVASDFGAHPFVLQKLAPLARGVTRQQLHLINHAFARADEQTKRTSAKPWMLVEVALVETAQKA
jgi:DNA polymerase III delta subunit